MVIPDDDELQFCWDPAKAAVNLAKHGVSFEAATFVFDDPLRLEEADMFAEGEYRNIVIGRLDGLLLTVVYAEPEAGLYRIISARMATPHERKTHERHFLPP